MAGVTFGAGNERVRRGSQALGVPADGYSQAGKPVSAGSIESSPGYAPMTAARQFTHSRHHANPGGQNEALDEFRRRAHAQRQHSQCDTAERERNK